MEETTPQILEIGLLLLAAVTAGWIARRIGLPATAGVIPNELFVAIVVAVTVSIAASSVAARAPALGPAQAAA